MSSSAVKELEAAVLALPRAERARLARHLIDSLDEDDEVEEPWQNEVRRRLDAFRTGDIESVDRDEVLEQARQAIER